MAGSVELLFFDDLFLDNAVAGGVCRNRGHGCGLGLRLDLGGRRFFGLLLAAQTKEAEAGGRQRIDGMRGGAVQLRLRRLGLLGLSGSRRIGRKCRCSLVLGNDFVCRWFACRRTRWLFNRSLNLISFLDGGQQRRLFLVRGRLGRQSGWFFNRGFFDGLEVLFLFEVIFLYEVVFRSLSYFAGLEDLFFRQLLFLRAAVFHGWLRGG